ncbi:hydantoinase/carbamoylase family amidase [Frigidibacter sp. MR17.24]|uniref:hydantoinase/carbamoylase family amidase n=1 Tax=Frigidibacter sp. MR17.24 TaxID=3127345 RepID=UPI003012D8D1
MASKAQITPAQIRDAILAQRDFATGFFADLAADSTDPAGGITRDTYGRGENHGHAVMRAAARDSGLDVTVDAAGNTYARWRAAGPGQTVLLGSHLDSVPSGGNFDGAAGALAGLVCIRALRALGLVPRLDICAMGIRAEESVWFQTSYIGSRAALATLPAETYDTARRIDTGRTLGEHMADCGCDVAALRGGARALDPATLAAFIELHIEQAPSLVKLGRAMASCTAVPGNFRYPDVRIIGEQGHVGTPRRFRRDAAMAGAELAARMDRFWAEHEAAGTPIAITFGRFHTDDRIHGLTSVPGLFHFSIDLRAYDEEILAQAEAFFLAQCSQIEAERQVRIELGPRKSAPVGHASPEIRAQLQAAAGWLGQELMTMGSPASHDAAAFAAAGVPMAMLFIRNANGSHNPDEAMEIDDFLEGCTLIAAHLARQYASVGT